MNACTQPHLMHAIQPVKRRDRGKKRESVEVYCAHKHTFHSPQSTLGHNNYIIVKFSTLRFSSIRIVKSMKWPDLIGSFVRGSKRSERAFDWIKLRIILIVHKYIHYMWMWECVYVCVFIINSKDDLFKWLPSSMTIYKINFVICLRIPVDMIIGRRKKRVQFWNHFTL